MQHEKAAQKRAAHFLASSLRRRSAARVFVVSQLLAAVAASAGRRVLQVVVPFQRASRRKSPIAHAATERPVVSSGHSYFLSSAVGFSDSAVRGCLARPFAASSKQPPYDQIPASGA